MSRLVPETELPEELSPFGAVEAAYSDELQRASDALLRGLGVLIECDKGLVPFFYKCLRDRLKKRKLPAIFLDGRLPPDVEQPPTITAAIIHQLRDAVRGAVDQRVLVLPHLDLLTTSTGALTSEAREVILLMYENPQLLWLGFRDPSFTMPRVILNLFPHRIEIIGVPRERLAHLVTRREARKLADREIGNAGGGLDVYKLYKYVSGVHAARLRSLLGALQGEDYPVDPEPAWQDVRRSTLDGALSLPDLDLDDDIGGYAQVKRRIRNEILDVILHKEKLEDPAEIERVESLVPRGMIFWGPPGTGKTLFAKAIASALGAAVQIISGPELKSRWVGESEENLRRVFTLARRSAPSLIVFDELDSFAAARGTFTGSGVEHSMVNQLLTEMDGFRKNEMVFVVGTTNFVESLDPALLRPGRFELHLHIPYPGEQDRRAILEIYNKKLDLNMSEAALRHAVKQSAYPPESGGAAWSGDHLQALGRNLARRRIRASETGPTEVLDVDAALTDNLDRPKLSSAEEKVVATHEAGHAIVALGCTHVPPIDRISIRGDVAGALGFVSYSDPVNKHVITRGQMRDAICVLFGGREAEQLLLEDLSIGSAHDLERATGMARALVERYGMGPETLVGGLGLRELVNDAENIADTSREEIDRAVGEILNDERARAQRLLAEQRDSLVALRDLLLEKKVLDSATFKDLHQKPEAVE